MSRGLVRIFRAKITEVEADFVDFDREGECEIFCGFSWDLRILEDWLEGQGTRDFWSIVGKQG